MATEFNKMKQKAMSALERKRVDNASRGAQDVQINTENLDCGEMTIGELNEISKNGIEVILKDGEVGAFVLDERGKGGLKYSIAGDKYRQELLIAKGEI